MRTSSGNVENTQLRFGPPGRDPFWPFTSLAWISTPTLGTTWLDQLTNRHVNCGDTYFLTLVQSRGDNRLWLCFRKYPAFFTPCVDRVSNICKFVICKFEHMQIWTYANLNIRKFEHTQIWTYANLNIRKFEHMQIWTYAKRTCATFPNLRHDPYVCELY